MPGRSVPAMSTPSARAGSRPTAAVAKAARPSYRCGACGWTAAKWVGRCGECQAWGTVEETGAPTARRTAPAPVSTPALPIADVEAEAELEADADLVTEADLDADEGFDGIIEAEIEAELGSEAEGADNPA